MRIGSTCAPAPSITVRKQDAEVELVATSELQLIVTARIDVSLAELRQVQERIDQRRLEQSDWPLVGAVFGQFVARAEARQERILSKMAPAPDNPESDGGGTAPVIDADFSVRDDAAGAAGAGGVESAGAGVPSAAGEGGPDADSDKKKRKGHGRNGAQAYEKAKHFFWTLAVGVIGAVCAACRVGKMYKYREKVIIRIVGQPLFGAEVHHYEQARCRKCGHIVRAVGDACVHVGLGTDYVRYDWSACAVLLVIHYSAGAPFKRLEGLHEGWGVPMPDANQWQLANASDDLLLPLYRRLERAAILTATNFRIDDTGAMVIELKRLIAGEIAALRGLGEPTKDVRTGINATGSYWETPNGPVILFHTGRHHAGEMVDQLLRHRPLSSPKIVKATDGATKNFAHGQQEKVIESGCNAHALLKFRDVKDKHPAEYGEAGRIYKQIFDNDDQAAALGLNPVDRMLFHRQHSKPLMNELKAMCEAKLARKLVEPNSPLWEPLTYVVNQWDRLIRFCEVPGVPLDTNLVEQALIMPVRYLAASFNYHTQDGAAVGDHAMSLIATARANGVDPTQWLTDCLREHEELKKNPENYLPWVYRERLAARRSSAAVEPPRGGTGPPEPVREPSEGPPGELRDLAPEFREGAARGVAAPDQDLQLAG